MATNDRAAKSMASKTANHTSLAKQTLRRQTPEVGAVCGNTARTDLCGGRVVTCVPTAIGSRGGGERTEQEVIGALRAGDRSHVAGEIHDGIETNPAAASNWPI